MPNTLDRRTFIARGAAVAGGGLLSTTALERLNAANASPSKGRPHHSESYGPLARTPDQRGVEVLALPAGFSYVTFSHSGSTMSDGNPTPLALDGMSAFSGRSRGEVRLVRNSEDRNLPGEGSVGGDPAAKYDPQGGGGTTTLVYDEHRRELVVRLHQPQRHDRELRRRARLRAAQLDHRRGVDRRARSRRRRRDVFPERHGYLFEVPLSRGPGELEKGEPIRAAGRFSHEAVAVDQRHGIVYETEDPGSGRGAGFYRYLPRNPHRLTKGGRLQMLAVRDHPQLDMREGQQVGRRLPVTWVDIDEPDPEYVDIDDPRGVFPQGYAKGGALFNRLEGCWEDHGRIFFVSTSGGDAKNGDVNPPMNTRRASGRSGSTGRAGGAARSSWSTSPRAPPSSTRRTTSPSPRAVA